eukprot:scaffold8119_cov102-Isochrysis_galbana.AAC.1
MDGLYVEKRKGSARRGGRGGRGGGIAAAAGMARRKQKKINRKRWPRRKTDMATWRQRQRRWRCGVAVMGNSYRLICKGRG